MKNNTNIPELSTINAIPEHCIWRIMRNSTKKPISRAAIKEMQKDINDFIKNRTVKADLILDEWNKQLSDRLKRKRITPEIIKEVCDNV